MAEQLDEPFDPLSPILPVPESLGDEEADAAAMWMRRHLTTHYTFVSLREDATPEQLAALAEWCHQRFEAAVAACPECQRTNNEEETL